MSIVDIIRTRRSIRSFLDRGVAGDVLDQLIEAASLAPSVCNVQPWRFRKVLKAEIQRLNEVKAYGQPFVYTAPLLIVVCSDPSVYDKVTDGNYQLGDGSLTSEQAQYIQKRLDIPEVRREIIAYDIGLALENMALRAVELSLGTCFVRLQDVDKLRAVLVIPKKYDIHLTVCVGYPAKDPEPRPRKPVKELII